MAHQFVKNKLYGYMEVEPKPSVEELRLYYEEKYYQNENALYTHSYSTDEIAYFKNKIEQKAFVVNSLLTNESADNKSLLDIGCGEGFTLDYYSKLNWKVTGLDFSDFGLMGIHPHLKENLIKGNITDEIKKLIEAKSKFDVIWLDNVLEHVINPLELLQQCNQLVNNNGVLVIEVPNDYSLFQKSLFEAKKVDVKYWEAYPDHLSYFSKDSLISLSEAAAWKTHKIISDFPIEWYLMNQGSNYVSDRSFGKYAHQSRLFYENNLHENNSKECIIDLYEALANVGHGRQLIGFFQK